MKKYAMMLAVVAMAAGVSANAESANALAASAQKNQVVTTAQKALEATESKLSVDEQAFAATLNDQNRKSFCDKLSAEQRQAVIVAAKNGANANEALQHMLTAKEMKASEVVDAGKASPATTK
jgi:hypothetical protein